MRRAIEYLVDRGYLVRRRGVGTQVVHATFRHPVELTSLFDDLILSGRNPRTEVLKLETAPAGDRVAIALGIEPGDPVIVLERLRYANDEPLAVMRNWMPENLIEPLLTMTRTTYNHSGQAVETGDHFYRASHYSFEIVLVAC